MSLVRFGLRMHLNGHQTNRLAIGSSATRIATVVAEKLVTGDAQMAPTYRSHRGVRGLAVAGLIVRGLPDALVQRLEERAARHGRSVEEEHRRLLTRALLSDGLGKHLVEIPEVGDDQDWARQRDLPRDADRQRPD